MAQLFAAPGYRGAYWAAIADVTVIPFTATGATAVQDQETGQFAVLVAPQVPVSRTSVPVELKLSVQVIVTLGAAG